MAHLAQQLFCESVKARFPDHFRWKRVLDCGSLDLNGSNRKLFSDCAYTGVDVGPGRNVDIVSRIHELEFPGAAFDTIISTECFEHDVHYGRSLRNIVRLLAPGGLFLFTCASTTRQEHGTRRSDPNASPLTSMLADWADYYKNLTAEDIQREIDVHEIFAAYEFSYSQSRDDLYFWGIKANVDQKPAAADPLPSAAERPKSSAVGRLAPTIARDFRPSPRPQSLAAVQRNSGLLIGVTCWCPSDAHERARYAASSLELLVDQTKQNGGQGNDLLVIDNDVEHDRLRAAIDRAAKEPWVTVLRLTPQRGWAGGRNAQLEFFLRGGWSHVAMCDQDLFIEDSTWLAELEGTVESEDLHGCMLLWDWSDFRGPILLAGGHFAWISREFIGTVHVVSRRAVEIIGGYNVKDFPQAWGFHDCEYGLRLRAAGLLNSSQGYYIDPIRRTVTHRDTTPAEPRHAAMKQRVISEFHSVFQRRAAEIQRGIGIYHPIGKCAEDVPSAASFPSSARRASDGRTPCIVDGPRSHAMSQQSLASALPERDVGTDTCNGHRVRDRLDERGAVARPIVRAVERPVPRQPGWANTVGTERSQCRSLPLTDAATLVSSLELPMRTVLHVGCGSNPAPKLFTGPQWRELRLDINPSVEPDIVASIVAMTPVTDACVDAVFSSHNLEHLYAHEVSLALAEFYRVLKPGGLVVVTMPDLQAVAAAVASGRLEETLYVSPGGPICPIDVLFGQRSSIRDGNVFMAHKTGFTSKTLRQKLEGAGFGNVRVEHGDLFDLWGAGYRPGTLS